MIAAIIVNNQSDDKPTSIKVTAKAGAAGTTELKDKETSTELTSMSANISSGAPLKVTLSMDNNGFVNAVTIEKRS